MLSRFINELNSFALKIKSFTSIPVHVKHEVPYISQFASAEYAEKILKEGTSKTSDSNWRDTGASTPEEYEKWVTTICGMACSAMAIEHFTAEKPKIITLAKDAQTQGVYDEINGELSGLKYAEFTKWVTKYGLNSTLYNRLTVRGIKYLVSRGSLVIASVSPNIRGYNTAPAEQIGGHLVLVTGYDEANQTVTFHNPSGFVSLNSHSDHTVSDEYFKKYFAGRGISLSK